MASKRVLVTGATGTLGRALVTALIRDNHRVTANFYRDLERAERLARDLGCELLSCDMSDEAAVEHAFETRSFETRFDAVFHLAARNCDALLPRISPRSWQEQLHFGARSAFLVTRASLQTLPRDGHLALVSSRVGERGFAGQSAYGANKAALLGLMKSAALEGRAAGICVNAICPGFAPSGLSQDLSDEVLAARARENWLPDFDAAESFAALGVWLLQTRVSGQILRPDCRM